MNNKILSELIDNQLKDIDLTKKLLYNDLKRISNYVVTSLFDTECCLWKGYITTINNDKSKYIHIDPTLLGIQSVESKQEPNNDNHYAYINFFHNKKKFSLHRLLYINYIGDLNKSEYIKFSCNNKGKCCNINHFSKVNEDNIVIKNIDFENNKKNIKNIIVGFD